uniref:Uncharacterized protein n=1 Tax=Opuntia streptacantha TaxID=393608 RepID=A0A7C8YZD3_OPUST
MGRTLTLILIRRLGRGHVGRRPERANAIPHVAETVTFACLFKHHEITFHTSPRPICSSSLTYNWHWEESFIFIGRMLGAISVFRLRLDFSFLFFFKKMK